MTFRRHFFFGGGGHGGITQCPPSPPPKYASVSSLLTIILKHGILRVGKKVNPVKTSEPIKIAFEGEWGQSCVVGATNHLSDGVHTSPGKYDCLICAQQWCGFMLPSVLQLVRHGYSRSQDTLVPYLLRSTLQYRILATTYDILYNDSKAALLSSKKYTVFPFGKMQQYYFSLFFSGTCAENREYRPEVSGV